MKCSYKDCSEEAVYWIIGVGKLPFCTPHINKVKNYKRFTRDYHFGPVLLIVKINA